MGHQRTDINAAALKPTMGSGRGGGSNRGSESRRLGECGMGQGNPGRVDSRRMGVAVEGAGL